MEMIEYVRYEDVNEELISEFPAFSVDEDEFELPYVTAGWFTKFILEAYLNGEKEVYYKGLHFIETLHTDENEIVRELATIGYLESIQNTWPKDLLDAKIPYSDLGEESKIWWVKLNDFWNVVSGT